MKRQPKNKNKKGKLAIRIATKPADMKDKKVALVGFY